MSTFRVIFSLCALVLFLSACSSSEQADQAPQSESPQSDTPQQVASSQPSEQMPADTPPPAASGGNKSAPQNTPSGSSGTKSGGKKMADSGKTASGGSGSGGAAATGSTPPAPKVSLGPGLAKVTASIVGVETKGITHIITLKIQQIHGRGASTPPLAATNEVKIMAKQAQIKLAGSKGPMLLKQGNNMELTIKYQKPMMTVEPALPSWSLMEVH